MAYYGNSYGGGGGGSYGRGGGGSRMGGLGADLQAVDWEKVKVPEVVWPKTVLASDRRDAAESNEWRKSKGVTVFNEGCPPPILSFEECPYPAFVLDSFKRQGFAAPTAIQAQSWPIALQNRDIVGIAKTGSGKTLAFLCPGIVHIQAQPPLARGDGPIMLVLAPTRELAKQIEDECAKVTANLRGFETLCAYGGTSKHPQKRKLYDGVQIIIACPGRLIDLLTERATNLHRVSYLVMDEADRMLDMGFEPQIRAICSQLRTNRQTLMFSATWPKEVQALAESYQKEYIRLHVGSLDLHVNADVRQHFLFTPDERKFEALQEILRRGFGKVLIFVAQKRDADTLCERLRANRHYAMSIHGDRNQQQRDYSLAQFKDRKDAVLVATDVAQRGLDIRNLDAVINYDFPMEIEDYVHRVGRTGRAGAQGDAFSFIGPRQNGKVLQELTSVLQRMNVAIPPELDDLVRRNGTFGARRRWGPPVPSFRYGGGQGVRRDFTSTPPSGPSAVPPQPPAGTDYNRDAGATRLPYSQGPPVPYRGAPYGNYPPPPPQTYGGSYAPQSYGNGGYAPPPMQPPAPGYAPPRYDGPPPRSYGPPALPSATMPPARHGADDRVGGYAKRERSPPRRRSPPPRDRSRSRSRSGRRRRSSTPPSRRRRVSRRRSSS